MGEQKEQRSGGRAKGLTALVIDAAKPDPDSQYEISDGKVPGLTLRVSPAGAKTWGLRYRTREGEQRRLTIGRYPSVGLSKARELAQQAIGDVAGGKDPAKARRAAKAAARNRTPTTVSGLIEAYFEAAEVGRHKPNGRPKRESTVALERDVFDRLIEPRLGKKAVSALGRHDLQAFLDKIHKKTPAVARHCRDLIRQAYNFGIRREIVTIRNPAQLAEVSKQATRDRVLSDGELKAIWGVAQAPEAADDLSLSVGTGLAICFAMATLQRGGEVCGIHARELDRDAGLWSLPGDRTKNHRPHVVPLSALGIQILDRAFAILSPSGDWKGYAFPSPRASKSGGQRPIDRHALTRAVARLTEFLKIEDAAPHDFRRTGSTNITGERIGMPRFIVSRVLNQVSDTGGAAAVTGVYDRNEYLVEKRRALDAWANLLTEIVSGTTRASNVRRLQAG